MDALRGAQVSQLGSPFETERLHVRLLTHDDIDVVHRQFSDPDMCRLLSEPPMDRNIAIETIDMFQNPERDPYLRYGLF
jgi:[ribosomal protein S5]-alanine N-acetyltransferase